VIAVSIFKPEGLAHHWKSSRGNNDFMVALCGGSKEWRESLREEIGERRICQNCERIAAHGRT
jgi:hypothetical protein